VSQSGFREIWLHVDESGGAVTTRFDPDVFADTVVQQPGPRRFERRRGRRAGISGAKAAESANSQIGGDFGGTVGSSSSDALPRRMMYQDPISSQYYPVTNVPILLRTYNLYGTVISSVSTSTDADGYYTGICNPSVNSFVTATPVLENNDIRMAQWAGEYSDGYCGDGPPQYVMPSGVSWLWSRLNEFIPFSRGLLNVSRGKVQVTYNEFETVSRYLSSEDRIIFAGNRVFNEYARFVVAHEYGHAIHEKALSGNAASGQCPSPHYLNGYYNLECAFSEGFADFIGATSQNLWDNGIDFARIVNYTNYDYYEPGADGSIQEAAVAAFLYDLTDSDGGDAGASEPWDPTFGERVAATIRDCRLRYGVRGVFSTRIRGVDDFAYCAERYIDAGVRNSFFITRYSKVSSISVNASASPFWPQSGVRAVWRKNLYGLD
jgi:hypothetical protein